MFFFFSGILGRPFMASGQELPSGDVSRDKQSGFVEPEFSREKNAAPVFGGG